MGLLALAFFAGVLTVLAPCIFPLLPVIIGSSASKRSWYAPYVVIGSLSLSILVFTYLLKASTLLIDIPTAFWSYFSGTILLFIGLTFLFPRLWERIPGVRSLSSTGNAAIGSGYTKQGVWGDALIGAALGPVFSSCSPTYFLILASVLPVSFALGTVYLLAYIAGLALVLLLIAWLGQRFIAHLTWATDPQGWFKRGLGIIFIMIGLAVMTGFDKKFEAWVLDSGFNTVQFENRLLEQAVE